MCRALFLLAAIAASAAAAPVTITAADITAQAVGGVWTATCSVVRDGVVITVPDNIYAVIPCSVRVTTTDPTVSAFAIAGMGAGSTIEFRDSSVTATFTTTSTSISWSARHAALRILAGVSLGAGSRIYLKDAMVTIVDHGTGRKGSAVLFDGGITVGDEFEFDAKASMLRATCAYDCLGFAIVGNAATGLTPSTFGSNVNIEFKSSSVEVDTTTGGTGFHIYKGVTFGDNAKFVFSGVVRVTTSATTDQHNAAGFPVTDSITFGDNALISPGSNVVLHAPGAVLGGIALNQVTFGERAMIELRGVRNKLSGGSFISGFSVGCATFGQHSKIMVTSSTLTATTQSKTARAFEISRTTFANDCEVLVSGSTLTASTPTLNAAALSISHTTIFGPNSMLSISRSHLTASAPLGFSSAVYYGHSVTLGDDYRLLVSGGTLTATSTGTATPSGVFVTRAVLSKRNTISVTGVTLTVSGSSASAQGISLDQLTIGLGSSVTISACTLNVIGLKAEGVNVHRVQMADNVSVGVLRSTLTSAGTTSLGIVLAYSRFGASGNITVADSQLTVAPAVSATGFVATAVTFGARGSVSVIHTTITAAAQINAEGLLFRSSTLFGVDSAVSVVACTIAAASLASGNVAGVRLDDSTLDDRGMVAIRDSTVNATAHTSHVFGFSFTRATLRPDSGIVFIGSHIAARSVTQGYAGAVVIKDSAVLKDRVAVTVSGGSTLTAASAATTVYGLAVYSGVTVGSDLSIIVRDSRVGVSGPSSCYGFAVLGRIDFGPRTSLLVQGSVIAVSARWSGVAAVTMSGGISLGPSSRFVVEGSALTAHSEWWGPVGIDLRRDVTFGDEMSVTVRRTNVTATAPTSASAIMLTARIQFGTSALITIDWSRIEARASQSGTVAVQLSSTVGLGPHSRISVTCSHIVATAGSATCLQVDRAAFSDNSSVLIEDSRLTASARSRGFGVAIKWGVVFGPRSTVTFLRSTVVAVVEQSAAIAVAFDSATFGDDTTLTFQQTNLTVRAGEARSHGLHLSKDVAFGARSAVVLSGSSVSASAGIDSVDGIVFDDVRFGTGSNLTLDGTNVTAEAGHSKTAGLRLVSTTFGPRGAVSLDRCRVVASSPSQSTAVHLAAPSYDGLSLNARRSALHFGAPQDAQQPAGALVCDGAGSWAAVALTLADVELAAVGASSPPAAEAAFVVWPPTVTGASPQRLTDVVVAAPAHRMMVPLRLPGGSAVGPDATLCLTRVRFGDGLPVRAGPPEFAVPPDCAFTPTATTSATATPASSASTTNMNTRTATMSFTPSGTSTRTLAVSATLTASSSSSTTAAATATRSAPPTRTRSRPTHTRSGTSTVTASSSHRPTPTPSSAATETPSVHPPPPPRLPRPQSRSAAHCRWCGARQRPTLPRRPSPRPGQTPQQPQ